MTILINRNTVERQLSESIRIIEIPIKQVAVRVIEGSDNENLDDRGFTVGIFNVL